MIFLLAFLSKNLEFMEILITAGFNMYNDKWIGDYLENPDFVEFPDYFNNNQENENNNNEISAFLDEEEYFNRRFRTRTHTHNLQINHELRKKIYNTLKYSYTNPLSLQEMSRVTIRKQLLKFDYKIKNRVSKLFYPKKLKDYLLFIEFNI
jgi:hypothetical protein